MQALQELFTSDVGLLSLGTIVFVVSMAGLFLRYFLHHMHEGEAKAARH